MKTYAIDDAHGNRLSGGLQENNALWVAQKMANNRKEPLYLYETREAEDSKRLEVVPADTKACEHRV
jgi:hypothetical protein